MLADHCEETAALDTVNRLQDGSINAVATATDATAADFTITITPDTTPFTIASTSPEEGYDWDSSEATQSNETDGLFSTVTLTFNKNIARVETEGKEIVLTNSTTGRISRFTVCSVSARFRSSA